MTYIASNVWLFQFAMVCYFVSFITSNILFLRFVLSAASVLLLIETLNSHTYTFIDCFWNIVFFAINFYHGCLLLWNLRPVEFKNDDFQSLYEQVFAPPHSTMSKNEFCLELTPIGSVQELKKGCLYCEYGTKLDCMSILISGSLEVCEFTEYKAEVLVNEVKPFEFIDSPQWLIRHKVYHKFQVILRATEDSKYITFPQDKLEYLISSRPEFKSYFDGIIGRDVAEKLLRVDPRVSGATNNNTNNGNNGQYQTIEDAPPSPVSINNVEDQKIKVSPKPFTSNGRVLFNVSAVNMC